MKTLKRKILNLKKEIFWGLALITIFFASRLINLTILPVFCDEAIYIRWAQIMKSVPSLRFLPLSDGKQPLFMWLMIPFLKIFADPLFAGRFVSVFAGFGSLVGIFFLCLTLTKSKTAAFLASLVYCILPYTLFFDRMALVDSLLVFFGIWALFLGIIFIKNPRLYLAIIEGLILGGALITKSPAIFFVALLPTTIILGNFKKQKKEIFLQIGKIFSLWILVVIFAFGIYNILRFGENFHMIVIRNKDYVFSFKEILSHPHDPLIVHLKDVANWFPNLFTLPIFISAILGIFLGLRKRTKESLILLAWGLVPLFAQSAVAKVFNSRYLLFTIFPFIIFAAIFLEGILKKVRPVWLKFLILLVFVSLALRYDFLLLTNPQKAPLTGEMKSGYLQEWTSGLGIPQARDFLKKQTESQKIVVGTEGFWGTLPDGLQIYFDKNPNITIIGVGLGFEEIPDPLKDASLHNSTYLVINQSRMGVKDENQLKLILKIPKQPGPKGQDYLLLYQLK